MKFIRFDEDHFGYLVDRDVTQAFVQEAGLRFSERWPGKTLIVIAADEFIDLMGQYKIVSVADLNEGENDDRPL